MVVVNNYFTKTNIYHLQITVTPAPDGRHPEFIAAFSLLKLRDASIFQRRSLRSYTISVTFAVICFDS